MAEPAHSSGYLEPPSKKHPGPAHAEWPQGRRVGRSRWWAAHCDRGVAGLRWKWSVICRLVTPESQSPPNSVQPAPANAITTAVKAPAMIAADYARPDWWSAVRRLWPDRLGPLFRMIVTPAIRLSWWTSATIVALLLFTDAIGLTVQVRADLEQGMPRFGRRRRFLLPRRAICALWSVMLLAPLISLGAKRTAIRVAPEACFWRKVATGCSSRIHGGNEAACAMSAACHRRGGKEAKEPRQQSPAVR